MVVHDQRAYLAYHPDVAKNGRVYSLAQPRFATDGFVRTALKRFDYQLYDSLRGYTKRPADAAEIMDIFHNKIQSRETSHEPNLDAKAKAALDKAIEFTRGKFKVDRYEPLPFEEVIDHMSLNKSAGFSFPMKKKADIIPDMLAKANDLCNQAKRGGPVNIAPCMLASRGHLSPLDDIKQRCIFNYPAEMLLIEGSYFIPFYEQMKGRLDGVMLFGSNIINRIYSLTSKQRGGGHWCVRSDISGFDYSVLLYIIQIAFDIVEDAIIFDTWGGQPMPGRKQKQWYRVWKLVETYFSITPVCLPDGSVHFKVGKVPSGSWGTQLIDSIVNCIYLAMLCFYFDHKIDDTRVLGDDGYMMVFGKPDLEQWSKALMLWFGVVLSVKKTRLFKGNHPQKDFLGYEFSGGFLHRTTEEWFKRALYTERDVETVEESFSRLVAYMFLGGVCDVRFTKFFEYFQSGYPLKNTMIKLDFGMQKQIEVLGVQLPLKELSKYTYRDFVFHLMSVF